MHRITVTARAIVDLIRRTDTVPLVALTAACLLFREQYPLSHFPMYSSFANTTHYVYLADEAGQPLPTVPTAGMNTPALKKLFDSEVREQRRAARGERGDTHIRTAGERVLAAVKSSPAAAAAGAAFPHALRLYRVDIELSGGRFEKRTSLVAELR